MKANILKILTNLKLYSTYYFAILSVLGAVWGAFAVYDNWKDNNVVLQTNVNTIIQAQTKAARTDSLLLKQNADMQEQLNTIQGTTEALESSYVKRLSNDKTLTKQDFLKYMEGLNFDVKKNSLTGQMEEVKPPLLNPTFPQSQPNP
jgi:hypothetical protein